MFLGCLAGAILCGAYRDEAPEPRQWKGNSVWIRMVAGGGQRERASEPPGQLVGGRTASSQLPRGRAGILVLMLLAQGPHFENHHVLGLWRTGHLTQRGGQEGFIEVGVL